jgi:hypothetical protein
VSFRKGLSPSIRRNSSEMPGRDTGACWLAISTALWGRDVKQQSNDEPEKNRSDEQSLLFNCGPAHIWGSTVHQPFARLQPECASSGGITVVPPALPKMFVLCRCTMLLAMLL